MRVPTPGLVIRRAQGGAQLHRTSVLRAVNWRKTSQGRRIHDLRHTAACLWLARSVDPGTVQAWMGHESIATTNLYHGQVLLGAIAVDRVDRLKDPSRRDRHDHRLATNDP